MRSIILVIILICGVARATYTVGTLTVGNIVFNDLRSALVSNYWVYASQTSKSASITYLTMATNQNAWTWPLNLSCVGTMQQGYPTTLISPNFALGCEHYGTTVVDTVTFLGTNGQYYAPTVVAITDILFDMRVFQLSSNLPTVVAPAYVFPESVTNKIAQSGFAGLPDFNLGNSSYIAPGTITSWTYNTLQTIGRNITAVTNNITVWANGFSYSGSPHFMTLEGKAVLLFATSAGNPPAMSTVSADFVSDPQYFDLLKAVVTNLSVIDLSNYANK